jgi:hypothetical protein
MTLRELLDQHHVDLDQEVGAWTMRRDSVEGPPERDHRTFLPGPSLDIQFTVDAPAGTHDPEVKA